MVTLFPHQADAVKWMRATENRVRIVRDQPHGGVLAHAMGLGKTISMLSMIMAEPPARTLVVCPKSLLAQWDTEARLVGILPGDIQVYHGPGRALDPPGDTPRVHTLIITTFETARNDKRVLEKITWDRVVLDEAHRICEAASKTAVAVRALRAHNRWCITGTPFKNGVQDLGALARFLGVAPYCEPSWWKTYQNNPGKIRRWARQFLNVLGKDVLTHLPRLVQHTLDVRMTAAEKLIYEQVSNAQWAPRVEEAMGKDQHELIRILRQRQASNHPLLTAPARVIEAALNRRMNMDGACAACAGDSAHTAACGHSVCEQ